MRSQMSIAASTSKTMCVPAALAPSCPWRHMAVAFLLIAYRVFHSCSFFSGPSLVHGLPSAFPIAHIYTCFCAIF